MKMKHTLIALGTALLLGLTGCGSRTQINVEQAGMLTTAVTSSDKFAGLVVSENVIEIERDADQTIAELYVSAGDEVRINAKLFEYDTDTLSLTVDKQQLEMDKLTQQIKDLKNQSTSLTSQINTEKKKSSKKQDKELLATLEMSLRQVNLELTEAEYKKDSLNTEITYNKDMLKNAVVRSPIKGTVRSINENGSPYITIQQSGSYQIKGILNELSLNAGIMEGVGVTILSRTDPTAYWTGVVSLVDYNNTASNEYDEMYGNSGDGMSTSTSYPFYITLDSTDGLLLGQHVYIQISAAAVPDDLLRIPEDYVFDIAMDEETYVTTGSVWGTDMETGKLTKLTVTVGEYDPTYGTYVILDGITAESYLANPADPGVREGADTRLRSELEYMGQTEAPETTAPTGETGVPGETGETGEAIGTDLPAEPEFPEDPALSDDVAPPAGNDPADPIEDPVNNGSSGSLVFAGDDEKPDE